MNVLRPVLCTNLVQNSLRCSRNFQPRIYSALNCMNDRTNKALNVSMYSSTAFLENSSKGGIFSKIRSKFENSKARLRASSTMLYENVADKINYDEFFAEFGMPDTFNSWFLVTELHCWFLLTRVMCEGSEAGQDGRFLRNSIVEAMWADVQTRSKKLSQDNPSAARRQVAILAEQFQATLINYDEGLCSDDKQLASALWRRFFEMKCDDYTKLEKLVKYVRSNTMQLESMTREQLIVRPQIEWVKLND